MYPLQNLCKKYQDYLLYQKKYSLKTITNYMTDIKQFFNICSKQNPKQVSREDITNYTKILAETYHLSNNSIHRKICAVKSFFTFLEQNGYIKTNISSLICNVKKNKTLPKFLHFNITKQTINQITNLRDKALLSLLLTTGMRVSEVSSILLDNLNIDTRSIKINGKGSKERVVFFPKEVQCLLMEYLSLYRPRIYLFEGRKNEPLSVRRIQYITQKYLHEHPHILRHTLATHLVRQGMQLDLLKDLLGHENLNTTQIYIHATQQDIKHEYDKILATC